MGHNLSAIVARGPGSAAAARRLGLTLVASGPFVIVPLDAGHAEIWSRRLGVDDRLLSDMTPDSPVTLRFAADLGLDRFALIRTSYFGGQGSQWATVYHGAERTMPVRAGLGAVNDALERIGVVPDGGRDAFDTIGLGGMRHAALYFDDGGEAVAG
ncbi:MAG: hypothetical protein KDK12_00285 [Rhodobacteraceae bacterium]|nr:hypothetical protein [Paracoccaceae bacterium]